MSKTLIAYFSASGVTARAAREMADAIGADLYEICPAAPYTDADLNWMDKKSRSTLEMNDPACRPAIASQVERMEQYDTVFVGFPVWWYVELRLHRQDHDPLCYLWRQRYQQSRKEPARALPRRKLEKG